MKLDGKAASAWSKWPYPLLSSACVCIMHVVCILEISLRPLWPMPQFRRVHINNHGDGNDESFVPFRPNRLWPDPRENRDLWSPELSGTPLLGFTQRLDPSVIGNISDLFTAPFFFFFYKFILYFLPSIVVGKWGGSLELGLLEWIFAIVDTDSTTRAIKLRGHAKTRWFVPRAFCNLQTFLLMNIER